jgi:hypothetical protein
MGRAGAATADKEGRSSIAENPGYQHGRVCDLLEPPAILSGLVMLVVAKRRLA